MALSEIKSKEWDFSNLFHFLDNGRFADFEIVCGAFVFKAHKAIICQKSIYFDTMNSEKWIQKETEARATLDEWDPAIVARLLVFLYKGSYPETDVSVCGIRQFSKIEDTFTGAGKQEFLHAQMYALAAKLNIPELFDIAHRAFKQRYIHSTHFSRKDWPDLVEYIYTSTASADKHLRISILYGMRLAISSDHQQVHDANLALVLKMIPDFAFDLITTEVSGKDSTCCPECSTYQQVLNERCAHGWSMDCTKGCWEDCLRKTECRYCDRVGLQNC